MENKEVEPEIKNGNPKISKRSWNIKEILVAKSVDLANLKDNINCTTGLCFSRIEPRR